MPKPAADVNAYIGALPASVRPYADTLRRTIRAALPPAAEKIRYGMPAYQIGDRTIIYFAIWKAHAALYPIYRGDAAFEARIAPFRDRKDTVRLALDGVVPVDLVTLIVRQQLASQAPSDTTPRA